MPTIFTLLPLLRLVLLPDVYSITDESKERKPSTAPIDDEPFEKMTVTVSVSPIEREEALTDREALAALAEMIKSWSITAAVRITVIIRFALFIFTPPYWLISAAPSRYFCSRSRS